MKRAMAFMSAVCLVWGMGAQAQARPPVTVRVERVEAVEYRQELEVIGTARSWESAVLSTQTSEKIAAIHFHEGAYVPAGDVLVSLEQKQESAASDAAQVQLDDARRQYERAKRLSARNFTSKAALDDAASALAEAEQRLAQTRAEVADRTIVAPFSGVLGVRNVSVGTLLRPGDVITTIDAIDRIRVDMDVPERYAAFVQVGQPFAAYAQAYAGRVFTGTLEVVASRIDPVARMMRLRGVIDNADGALRPGMLLRVKVQAKARTAIVVPEEALVPIARRHWVYVLDDGKVVRTEVTPAQRFDGMVEIVAGVEQGQQVVTHGQLKLTDGQSVMVDAAP